MLKLFLYDRIQGQSDCKLLRLMLLDVESDGKIFQKIKTAPFKKMVEFVSTVEEAHYILMPNDYSYMLEQRNYFEQLDKFAAKYNKKVIVSNYTDYTEPVPIKNSIVLRTSSYRTSLQENEIIVPAFIEDMGDDYGVTLKHKNEGGAVVGFAGMVALSTKTLEIKYQIKILIAKVRVILGVKRKAEFQGLYFRRQAINVLEGTSKCKTRFIIRNTFSGLEKTLSKDPETLRSEYVSVFRDSDLGLVIRGNGNFSLRFFETLSMGLIPLFIDTDTPLPLEEEIDYDSFMLRVDYASMRDLPSIIKDFWDNLSDEKFVKMQKMAREVYETKLRPDVFYKNLFDLLEKKAEQEITQ